MVADILAEDAMGRPILLANVRGKVVGPGVVSEMLSRLESSDPPIPYGMAADLETIQVMKFDCGNPIGFSRSFNTGDILRHYDEDFGNKRIFHDYLATLIEAWLRDLAYHWKSEDPPGAEELSEIGLTDRLEGGTTRSEVPIGGDPVR